MNRPYPTYSTNPRRGDTYRGYAETEVIEDYDGYRRGYAPDDENDDDHLDDEVYSYVEPIDRRWIWVAGVAGAVLLVAVICTVVILGGGDSGSVSATVAPPPATRSAPAATTSAPPAAPSTPATPAAPLPAETVTTVSPTPTAEAPPSVAPPPEVTPISPRTVTYRVTGTRQLFDLVTIIYTDNQGALQTDVNVALPWTKQIVLDPGVELKSVTATSVTGQLNCSITNSSGTVVAAQNSNTLITTCTQ